MKKNMKLFSLFTLGLLFTLFSCDNDDNSTPIITLVNLDATIDENPSLGQVLGTIQSNTTSPLTYSISSQTPAGALNINASTGELTIADETLFDYEMNSSITATIDAPEASNSATVIINLNNLNEIGDFNYGGIVFWIDPTDDTKGLVCAIEDQTSSIRWDNPSGPSTPAPGTSNAFGTGATNTDTIIAHEGAVETNYAAGIARAYNGGGFNDWFLPSVDELVEMNNNKTIINTISTDNGGTDLPDQLWSSSKINSTDESVYLFNLTLGAQNGVLPINFRSVRAIRAF